jgi:hypothetical protein
VPGNLTTTIGLDERNMGGLDQVLGVTVQTQCVDGWMLQEPDFIWRGDIARLGKASHLLPAEIEVD